MKTKPLKHSTMLRMLGSDDWMLINHHFEECRFIICQNCTKFYQYCDWVMAKSVPLPPKSWKRHQKIKNTLFVNPIFWNQFECWSIIILRSGVSLFVKIAQNFISIAIEWWRRAFHFPEIMKTTPKTLTMLRMNGANRMLINHHFEECRVIICQKCTKFYQYCDWVMAKSVPLPQEIMKTTPKTLTMRYS